MAESQSWASLPIVMIGVAHLLAAQDPATKVLAVGLLAKVLCHRATWDEYRYRAERLLRAQEATLPVPAFAEAMASTDPVNWLIRDALGVDLPNDALALADSGCSQPWAPQPA